MFECKNCKFLTKSGFNYQRHCNTQKHLNMIKSKSINPLFCVLCNKEYKYQSGFSIHKKKCRPVNPQINNTIPIVENNSNEIEYLKLENKMLTLKNQINTIDDMYNHTIRNDTNKMIIIENKLYINNIEIMTRNIDKYISVTQICNIYNKTFNDWYKLDKVRDIINYIVDVNQIIIIKLVDNSELPNNQWVHPDLVSQFCQWISPKISLYINKFIRTLLSNTNEMLISSIKQKEEELSIKDQRILLLENMVIKRQERQRYPDNVIYLLTTNDIKEKGVYIIGKAKSLTNRLSTYNKTSEHEVIYYKQCNSFQDMNVIEKIIIEKLIHYKERSNRDRLILSDDIQIQIVKDTIKQTIESYNI